MDLLAHPVCPVFRDHLGCPETMDILEDRVLKVHPVPPEALVSRVYPDERGHLGPREKPVSQEFLANPAKKVPAVSLVFPATKESLDSPERLVDLTLVPLARTDYLVSMVFQA